MISAFRKWLKLPQLELLLRNRSKRRAGNNASIGRSGYSNGGATLYVARLAGMLPPFNHFEIADLRDRALAELGIVNISQDEAVHNYAVELLSAALDGDMDLIEAVAVIAQLCIGNDYQRDLYDFYLLNNAHEDLKHDDVQWYWADATRQNIVSIIEERAKAFVAGDSLTH